MMAQSSALGKERAAAVIQGAQKGTMVILPWETSHRQVSSMQVPSLMRTASSWCREVEAGESEVKKADFMSFSQQIAGKLNCSCCVTQPSNF